MKILNVLKISTWTVAIMGRIFKKNIAKTQNDNGTSPLRDLVADLSKADNVLLALGPFALAAIKTGIVKRHTLVLLLLKKDKCDRKRLGALQSLSMTKE